MTALSTFNLSQRTQRLPREYSRALLILAALIWWALYQSLISASEAIVAVMPVDRDSHLGGALQFFLYDTPKVLLLLTAVVFVMGMVNSYFTPERTRALLAGRTEGVANVMAASLGVVTSGPTSWPASPSARSSTAGCRRTSWRPSWARTPGGRCRWRC